MQKVVGSSPIIRSGNSLETGSFCLLGRQRPPKLQALLQASGGSTHAPVTLVGETPIPAGDIKNGNVTISTSTAAPVSPVPGAPGCPNSNWTEVITDVSFTSASIQLFQDSNENGMFEAGELVLSVSCTFSPPTSNGAVPRTGFTCA
jgi:hypothetical protein